MGNVYITSDLHLGHKNIPGFRNKGKWALLKTEEEHADHILSAWEQNINKRDIVIIAGDILFDPKYLDRFRELPGRKQLVLGNHDDLNASIYTDMAEVVRGAWSRKRTWITHIPVHPLELRGRLNVHGHVHYSTIQDRRYMNVCVEEAEFEFPFFRWDLDVKPRIAEASAIFNKEHL